MRYKYVISAKGADDVNSGNGSMDAGTPISQTEAATELIINRLCLISYYNEGLIDENTTIVTLKERVFLYENIFKNVEIYNINKTYDNCLDLVTFKKLDELCDILPYKPFYKNYDRDKKEILNIAYNEKIINEELPEFIICIPRLKNADRRRNLDQSYWYDFINEAKKIYGLVIVFGKGNENIKGENIRYVDTLQDYCSYLHHIKCIDVVSTISGPCHYVQQFGNVSNNTILTMIDNLNLIDMYNDSPSYFNPCINFTNVKINLINELVSPKILLEKILYYDR